MVDETFWRRIKENDFQPAPEYPLDEQIAELEHLLTYANSQVRDGIAFEILGEWIQTGRCDHDLPGLGDRMAAQLLRGIGEVGTDSIFGRSFAALVLGLVVERDNAVRVLSADDIRPWLGGFTMWWELEGDLRGSVDAERGWAHALAHGADTIASFARSRLIGTDQARALLGSIVVRLRTTDGWGLFAGEDDRLAYATMSLLHRGDLGVADLAQAIAPLRVLGRADLRIDLDAAAFTRVNTLNWLRALYLQLRLGVQPMPWYAPDHHFDRPIPQYERMLAEVESLLREYSSWFRED
ncbi:MAG: DUF2785 domain-containing protein [Hamadaea sp.]|nr:DUF2785 domain-containing protein [Hamadaea sp.]